LTCNECEIYFEGDTIIANILSEFDELRNFPENILKKRLVYLKMAKEILDSLIEKIEKVEKVERL
jgi:hypothetical protein